MFVPVFWIHIFSKPNRTIRISWGRHSQLYRVIHGSTLWCFLQKLYSSILQSNSRGKMNKKDSFFVYIFILRTSIRYPLLKTFYQPKGVGLSEGIKIQGLDRGMLGWILHPPTCGEVEWGMELATLKFQTALGAMNMMNLVTWIFELVLYVY